jgi:fatty acid desaturase
MRTRATTEPRGTTLTSPTTYPAHVQRASAYGQLLTQVRRAGLLERSPLRYLPRFAVLAAATLAGLAAFLWLGDTWWQLATAACSGLLFAQVGFLGHDAGHQQIFRSKRWNDRLGLLLSNLGVGLSFGWWVDKHNRHHRNPNEVGRDPDVQRNVLAWTEQQARSQRGLLRSVARHQDVFFFPLLLLEGWNLHVGSIRVLLCRRRASLLEATLLAVHVVGGLALLLAVLSPVRALVFIAVQQSAFGLYLGATFAPNHKGMKIIDPDARPDFLRRQVLTSRNLTGGRLTTVAFGGLNYQIEHHLFPSMPSRNLQRCRPLVRAFCDAHSIPYVETSVLDSYRRALHYLRSLRPGTIPAATSGIE